MTASSSGSTERWSGVLISWGGRTSITLAEGMSGMMESTFINVKNRSKTITAEIDVPEKGAHGIILAQAGRFGGWALYAKDGVPAYDYNFLGLKSTTIAGSKPLTAGQAHGPFRVRLRRRRAGQGRHGHSVCR